MDDRIVDVVRRAAQTTARHALFVSRGTLEGDARAVLVDRLPDPFGRRLATAPDSLELIDDLHEAEALLARVQIALELSAIGHGAHALLARRDGTVDLAQRGCVSTVRHEPFPGFADIAA